MDLVNKFGVLEGFSTLQERICDGSNLSVPLLAALLRFVVLSIFIPYIEHANPTILESICVRGGFGLNFYPYFRWCKCTCRAKSLRIHVNDGCKPFFISSTEKQLQVVVYYRANFYANLEVLSLLCLS